MPKNELSGAGGIALKIVQPAPLIVIDSPHWAHYLPEDTKVGYLDFNPEGTEYPQPTPTRAFEYIGLATQGLLTLISQVEAGLVTQPDILVGQTNSATSRLAQKLGFTTLNPLRDQYCEYHLGQDMSDDQLIEVTHDLIMSPQIIGLFTLISASPNGRISAQNRKNLLRFVRNEFVDPVSTVAYFFQIVDMIGAIGMNDIWKTNFTETQFEFSAQQTAILLGLDLLLLDGQVIYVSWSDFLAQIASIQHSSICQRLCP